MNSIEYDKIFLIKSREGDVVKRLIFCGKGGVGKSTFFDKIAYDWSVRSSHVLNKYKLVFVLKMCALHQSSNLIEAIFDQLLAQDTDITKYDLESFIVQYSDVVLILLDGFDELTMTTLTETLFGSILRALNRKKYRECCIGVTTRPSHLERLIGKSLVQSPFILLKVLGFKTSEVKEYVINFFSDDPDNSEILIREIEMSDVLSDLARSPMLLLLMCVIWREDAALPSTMSRLYSKAVDYMFQRKGHVSKKKQSNMLIEIGKVAMNGLLDPEQKLTFAKSKFEKNTLDLALKVGILNSQRVFKNLTSNNSIQFLHKTMQELCAAKYWQSLLPISLFKRLATPKLLKIRKFQNILDRISDERHNIGDFEYLLRFCCGDNEVCMYRILERLVKLTSSNFTEDQPLKEISLHCYLEGQSEEIPSKTYIKSLVTDHKIVAYSNSHFHSLMLFLSNVCKSKYGRNYLEVIEIIEFQNVFIMGSIDLFAIVLSNLTHIQALTLPMCSLISSDLKTIALNLKDNTYFDELILDYNETLGGTAAQWAPHMKHLKTLRTLGMAFCNIQPGDMEHILNNVSKSVTELDLRGNNALGGSTEIWSRYLCFMINLKGLDLSCCSLVSIDVDRIAIQLSESKNLAYLSLGGLPNVWSYYLNHLKHLQVLNLGDCSLLHNDIERIAISFSEMTNLTYLILGENSSLGGSANVWANYLCFMKYLQVLDLGACSLVCNDIEHIANALSEMTNLTYLFLGENSFLRGSAYVWSRYLYRMKHLKVLVLCGCSLVFSDIVHIAKALSEITNLTIVNLSDRFVGLYLDTLVSKIIYLRRSLTHTDRATISELFAKMTNPFSVEYR